ncbi:MAG TPA: GNAT family N-acetyltransferase [Allosphingosinicella sp.]|nr:GNAT family N-acetyltransferase [Allosphingosinicella sp.]
MADPRDEMLKAMAAHRGLKLVKSRRRKPGGDFGRYGLTDAQTGQDCFGIGKDGLEATAEAIEDYLRRGATADWKRSLGAAGKAAAKARPKKQAAERDPEPKRRPTSSRSASPPRAEPEPEPELVVRDARAADAEAIAGLLGLALADVKTALRALVQAGEPPVIAEQGGLVGCAAWHVMPTLQHGQVGRITMLRVEKDARRRGVGRGLVEAVEARLADRGCNLFEAVSDIDFEHAQGFFRRLGYERTSYRFAKPAAGN